MRKTKLTEPQKRAIYKYCKENTTCICLRLNNKTDKNIIKLLNKQDNKNEYIKKLLKTQL